MFENDVTVYNEAGKARKKCPGVGCSYYLHARSQVCQCGYEFKAGAKAELQDKIAGTVPLKTSDKAGRGKKQCLKCKVFVGVRTAKCSCGYVFQTAIDKFEDKLKQRVEDPKLILFCCALGYPNPRCIVHTPAGHDEFYKPWPLPKNNTREAVESWANTVFITNGHLLSPNALRYILRMNGKASCIPYLNDWVETLIGEQQREEEQDSELLVS